MNDYSIMELVAPKEWVGFALNNLYVRNKFGLNILGIRNGEEAKLNFNINRDYVIKAQDQLLVIVEANKFETMEYQGKR